ncbi:hypothetical protein KDW_32490 [Dictyobacter vulcani]|uniref:Pentapeptide repeat-containing protein n=2 Tax=Dictyobacter vulcani TaxID=2607529 RepID=A0A5J4KRS3_9CHLR|nr:hypothetical protein KDW_32490 [Dictyobacter vulcani]
MPLNYILLNKTALGLLAPLSNDIISVAAAQGYYDSEQWSFPSHFYMLQGIRTDKDVNPMRSQKQRDLLLSGKKLWNAWRKEFPDVQAVEPALHEADLHGMDLRNFDLHGADLTEANLQEVDLRGADLCGADLRGANLSGANLSGVNLSEAHLRWADLRNAMLGYADLSRADLSHADLRGAFLEGALLRNAHFDEVNLSGVDLSKVDLSRENLRTAKLVGAIIGIVRVSSMPDTSKQPVAPDTSSNVAPEELQPVHPAA